MSRIVVVMYHRLRPIELIYSTTVRILYLMEYQDSSRGWDKGRPARKADKLTAFCEPNV
jgi:hypothetical protein